MATLECSSIGKIDDFRKSTQTQGDVVTPSIVVLGLVGVCCHLAPLNNPDCSIGHAKSSVRCIQLQSRLTRVSISFNFIFNTSMPEPSDKSAV
jgi:hypothetical protein